jgi:hypothetical protein
MAQVKREFQVRLWTTDGSWECIAILDTLIDALVVARKSFADQSTIKIDLEIYTDAGDPSEYVHSWYMIRGVDAPLGPVVATCL